MKTRVELDEKMLDAINDYHTARLEEDHIGKECFSHPDLDSHFCCAKSPIHGGKLCDYCGHRPDRICKITCNIHHWCLAVFAYRLGIGEGDVYKAVRVNLKESYDDLLANVRKVLSGASNVEQKEVEQYVVSTPVYDVSELDKIVGETPEAIKEEENQNTEEEEMEEENTTVEMPDDLISIKDAADCWPCTLPNIYAKIKSGVLVAYKGKGGQKVSRADIDILRTKKRGGGRKKKDA